MTNFYQAMSDSLCSIKQLLTEITLQGREKPVKSGWWVDNLWKYKQTDREIVFQRQITHTGSEQNIDLTLSSLVRGVRLNWIELSANDTTSKDISIRLFNGPYENYINLKTVTSNTAISLFVTDSLAMPSIQKIRFVTTGTNNKTLIINVQVTLL